MNIRNLLISFIIILTSISVSVSQVSHKVNFLPNDITFTKTMGEDSVEYDKINLHGGFQRQEAGKPDLPIKIVRLIISPDQDVDVVSAATAGTIEKTGRFNIYPAQLPCPTSIGAVKPKFVKPDTLVYGSDVCYPTNPVIALHQDYFDGDKHIVTIAVCPFQYYPKSGRLIVNTSLELGLQYKSGTMKVIHHGIRDSATQRIYDQALQSMVDNPEMIGSYSAGSRQNNTSLSKTVTTIPHYKYVVITTSALQSYFNKFIAWKKRKGVDIGIVTTDWIYANYSGDVLHPTHAIYDNAGKIRQYLSEAYPQGTTYALLGGDSTVVPIRYGTGINNTWTWDPNNPQNPSTGCTNNEKIPADLYFADFNGDWNVDGDQFYGEPTEDQPDYNPEIFVGRLLCTSGQDIMNWTDKVIRYELNPGCGDITYLTKSFMHGADAMREEPDVVSPHLPSFNNNKWKEQPSAYEFPTSPSGTQVIAEMNNHYGLISWFMHGNMTSAVTMSNGDGLYPRWGIKTLDAMPTDENENNNGLDNLTNTKYPAILYTVGCWQTPFDNFDPWGNPGPTLGYGFTCMNTSGGPAFLGNTRDGYNGCGDIIYCKFGDLITAGNTNLGVAELISKYQYFTPNDYYSHHLNYAHNLVGCPETPMWTAIPTVFSSASVTDNGTSVTVNAGIGGCIITASSCQNGLAYYNAYNAQSNVTSYTFSTSVRPLYITITKQNYLPYTAITGGLISSNETWFESMKVLGNVIINPGGVLTISPNTSVSFANGSSLAVNSYGTLTANGSVSSPIIFNFISPNSSTQNGIIFTTYSMGTISYCEIRNAYRGIYENGVSINVVNSAISNCRDGLFLYNSAPTIQYVISIIMLTPEYI